MGSILEIKKKVTPCEVYLLLTQLKLTNMNYLIHKISQSVLALSEYLLSYFLYVFLTLNFLSSSLETFSIPIIELGLPFISLPFLTYRPSTKSLILFSMLPKPKKSGQ